jgi:small conductance mechanosensitive channel
VTNLTKDFSYALFDVGVSDREKVDEVMRVLHDRGAGMRQDPYFRRLILERLAGVDRFTDTAVVIEARIKTRPLRQSDIARELNRRTKNRFDELAIEMPSAPRAPYFGADQEGRAPPAHVAADHAEPATAEQATRAQPAEVRPDQLRSSGG